MTTETIPQTTPIETVTPIKPSEALRLGRLVRPAFCSGTTMEGEHAACAMGAMAIGWGYAGSDADVAWDFAWDRLWDFGDETGEVWRKFDAAVWAQRDGHADAPDPDAAVLAYLESRGL